MARSRRDPAAPEGPQRAHRARDDPRRRADLARRDLAPGRDLEADRLARAPVAARRRPRPRDDARSRAADATARSSSSPCPEAALVLGLDLGARFLRGAICDLRGDIRARQDVELDGADAEGAIDAIAGSAVSLAEASGLPAEPDRRRRRRRAGRRRRRHRPAHARDERPGPRGPRLGRGPAHAARAAGDRRERHQPRRARRALAGVARGVDDFVFLSVGTGPRRGPRAARRAAPRPATARPARSTSSRPAATTTSIRARPRSPRSPERLVDRERQRRTHVRPPYDARGHLRGGAHRRRARARASWTRRRAGSRSTSPRSPPSPTSRSSCSAAASARTATCSSTPIRRAPRPLAAVSAARRGLEPRRRRGPDGRARRRPPLGPRQRLREPPPRDSAVIRRRCAQRLMSAVGGVAVDLLELVGGEVERVERRDVLLQLLDAARADQRGGHPRVAQHPGERQLGERLAAARGDLVQRAHLAPASARSAGRARARCRGVAREPSGMPSR